MTYISKNYQKVIILLLVSAFGFVSCETADTLTVTGPITGGLGKPFTASILDLNARGYIEEEFFFEGNATAYDLNGEMTMDGKWTLVESTKEKFKTRMLVRRPLDSSTFNGTVIVEWLNVTAGADGDPGFMYNWQEILREGYAWVGVSAQKVGVEGGRLVMVEGTVPLKEYDPERYGSLYHPGDAYSYDIFTLASEVIRGGGGVDVLGGLHPKRLMAYGESQSAYRMVSYVNGVYPLVDSFDGFFIHSRNAGATSFGRDGILSSLRTSRDPVHVRNDLNVPVFQFQTETDVMGTMSFYKARQTDSDLIRTWEVAGTAHADKYMIDFVQFAEEGDASPTNISCENINDGPQHFVIKAALHAVNRWMSERIAPPLAKQLAVDQDGNPITDEHGNTLGGVRSPDVDVPIATLSGLPIEGADMLCSLFGNTISFTPEKLIELYPTHTDYVEKVKASARLTREAGFILAPEEQSMVAEAEAALIPK